MLPIIVDTAYSIYGDRIPHDQLLLYKKRAQRLAWIQTVRTEEFLTLYRMLSEQSFEPIILKGIVCRLLYPKPDLRFSADEDLLIPPDDILRYHEALQHLGLHTDVPEKSLVCAQEVTYVNASGTLHLELHRFPFPPDSDAYGNYNDFFTNAERQAVSLDAGGTLIRTLSPTDHLFYLVCHALKHFLHSGCGIRQVCDICLFAKTHAEAINWQVLADQMKAIHAIDFTNALFAIGETYLGIQSPLHMSQSLGIEDLLSDILDSGVFGSASMSRKHSATITLSAVEHAKQGGSGSRISLRRTLFPSAKALAGRYAYLTKCSFLLPVVWIQRLWHYIRRRNTDDSPDQALRIGRERVSLLRKYGLLPESPSKVVDTETYLSEIREVIEQGYEVGIPVAGNSMSPFLVGGRDWVSVRAPSRPLRRGDIVLYERKDGSFVLHRICRVHEKGTFDILGDAQTALERGIQREQIIAVVTKVRRKGKILGQKAFWWLFFQYVWIGMIPLRHPMIRWYTECRHFIYHHKIISNRRG